MNKNIAKCLLVLCLSVVVTGCKLAVMVNEGGTVQSLSGTHNCAEGTICTIQIADSNFSESFTAAAKAGYEFVKWNTGGGFLCANSTSPICTVALSGDANSEAVVATYTTAYIMPVFGFVGIDSDGDGVKDHLDADDDNDGVLDVDDACPLLGPNVNGLGCPTYNPPLDPVIVEGREWLQPRDFVGLSWNDISIACDSNNGLCTGTLAGINLAGYTWASVGDVNGLFDHYLSDLGVAMSPGGEAISYAYAEISNILPWTFFDDFLPTMSDWNLVGRTRTNYPPQSLHGLGIVQYRPEWSPISTWTTENGDYNWIIDHAGGWFYRDL